MIDLNDDEMWECVGEGETGIRCSSNQVLVCEIDAGPEFWLENYSGEDIECIFGVGDEGYKTVPLPQTNHKPTIISTDTLGLKGDLTVNLMGREITLFKSIDPKWFERPEELKVGLIIGKHVPKPLKTVTEEELVQMTDSEKEAEFKRVSDELNVQARDNKNSGGQHNSHKTGIAYGAYPPESYEVNQTGNVTYPAKYSGPSEETINETVYIFCAAKEGMPAEGLCDSENMTDEQYKWLGNSLLMNMVGSLASEFGNLAKALLKEGSANKAAYLKELLFKGLFYIKESKKGEYLIIFKGAIGNNKYLTAAKYLATNNKMAYISSAITIAKDINAGNIIRVLDKINSVAKATKHSITFIITTLIETAKFFTDNDIENDKNWGDLFGMLYVSFVKVAISLRTGFLFAAAFAAGLVFAKITVPVLLTVAIGIGVSMFVGFLLDKFDTSFGITYSTKDFFHSMWHDIFNEPTMFTLDIKEAIRKGDDEFGYGN